MNLSINIKELRSSLPKVVARVRRGAGFTVIYRGRPAFQIVPIEEIPAPCPPLAEDSLYRAAPVGRSRYGRGAAEHDDLIYGF